jgi:hypothetical protein
MLMNVAKYSDNDIYRKALSEQWVGTGTSEDPFIIKSTHSFPLQSIIKGSSFFILVINCHFRYLTLKRCKNVRFKGCIFDVLQLLNCSDIAVQNCSFNVRLDLIRSNSLGFQNSRMSALYIGRSHENYFRTCSITSVTNYFSKANKFESVDMSIENFKKILSGSLKQSSLLLIGLIGLGFISIVSAITLFFNRYSNLINWSLIVGLIVTTFISFTLFVTFYSNYKKMHKYSDNHII